LLHARLFALRTCCNSALFAVAREACLACTSKPAFGVRASSVLSTIIFAAALIDICTLFAVAREACLACTSKPAFGVRANSVLSTIIFAAALIDIGTLFAVAREACLACTSKPAFGVRAGGVGSTIVLAQRTFVDFRAIAFISRGDMFANAIKLETSLSEFRVRAPFPWHAPVLFTHFRDVDVGISVCQQCDLHILPHWDLQFSYKKTILRTIHGNDNPTFRPSDSCNYLAVPIQKFCRLFVCSSVHLQQNLVIWVLY